ncbi:hypothetical protein GJT88_00955 [Enterobacteriaceae endosymbiont of Donacia tomentosa]|uniref:CAF17-like 4Fe-4S cluster assembly/insertion protein YgfZ n=1 Tax=Enterobacteriaceae endosymbiont of Donacia tomentosa TaxID=2675787 RepID=UPI00144A275F|nr:hypothetical protein [Enterobacteriaceae endosymbiont of Donacia tomentosa]QJC31627.1 hypothetical protein GJT88_00955 [Enterobacteriaceae endosymbiont of Donacia tomentosa]
MIGINDHNNLLKLIKLNDWKIITIKGPDAKVFLQNQLTLNINKLDDNINFFNAVHCDVKGNILTNMHIFKKKNNNYSYLIRTNIVKDYLKNIKKYIILYKISIFLETKKIFGILGEESDNFIFNIIKNKDLVFKKTSLFFFKKIIFLKFYKPITRYLIILSKNKMNFFLKNCFTHKKVFMKNNDYWLKLNMEIGYPIIDKINNHFLPQQANMEAFNSIDFNKGCYLGQEIINNFQFRKKKNKTLFLLEGKIKFLPAFNDILEFKDDIKNRWNLIRGSIILKSLKLSNNKIWVQVILQNNIKLNTYIRFKKDKNNIFFIIKKFNVN